MILKLFNVEFKSDSMLFQSHDKHDNIKMKVDGEIPFPQRHSANFEKSSVILVVVRPVFYADQ